MSGSWTPSAGLTEAGYMHWVVAGLCEAGWMQTAFHRQNEST